MRIELYEARDEPEERLEVRTYELDDRCVRILIDVNRKAPDRFCRREVWGFEEGDRHQHEGVFVNCEPSVVITG
jgi:hypothetical protein